jgi:hypothetical protein
MDIVLLHRFVFGLQKKEHTFVWKSSSKPMQFRNWGGGQPDNYKQAEDCVETAQFITGRVWNDQNCFETGNYPLCQSGKKTNNKHLLKTIQ